jgi:hypothetical protein
VAEPQTSKLTPSQGNTEPTRQLNVRIPEALWKDLQRHCIDEDIQVQEAAARAVRLYLSQFTVIVDTNLARPALGDLRRQRPELSKAPEFPDESESGSAKKNT